MGVNFFGHIDPAQKQTKWVVGASSLFSLHHRPPAPAEAPPRSALFQPLEHALKQSRIASILSIAHSAATARARQG